jgi:hypothetical protein
MSRTIVLVTLVFLHFWRWSERCSASMFNNILICFNYIFIQLVYWYIVYSNQGSCQSIGSYNEFSNRYLGCNQCWFDTGYIEVSRYLHKLYTVSLMYRVIRYVTNVNTVDLSIPSMSSIPSNFRYHRSIQYRRSIRYIRQSIRYMRCSNINTTGTTPFLRITWQGVATEISDRSVTDVHWPKYTEWHQYVGRIKSPKWRHLLVSAN